MILTMNLRLPARLLAALGLAARPVPAPPPAACPALAPAVPTRPEGWTAEKDFPGCRRKPASRRRCKYHVEAGGRSECFSTKDDLRRRVSPTPVDVLRKIAAEADPVGHAILCASLEAHWRRVTMPAGAPEAFRREFRLYDGKNPHHGWEPAWPCGATRPGWSYRKGFDPTQHKTNALQGAREEIREDVAEAAEALGAGAGIHMHHAAPWTFERLFAAFLDLEKVGDEDSIAFVHEVGIEKPEDGSNVTIFADREFADRWRAFHLVNATLIPMTPAEHKAAERNERAGLLWDGSGPLPPAGEPMLPVEWSA